MLTPTETPQNSPQTSSTEPSFPKLRTNMGLTLAIIGFVLFLFGCKPELFGLDKGTSIGVVQIIVILIGIGMLTAGSTITLMAFWRQSENSLLADFGSRVIATGYLICVFTALADAFGFGTNPMPQIFLGRLQSYGVIFGMAVIALGMLMLLRFKRS